MGNRMGKPRYSAEEFEEVRLMVANADITIYHKTGRDPQTRADVWAATVYADVHLYSKLAAQESGNGRAPANTYTVRIFGEQGAPCRIGDVIACGITTQPSPQTARAAGVECFEVYSIADNRRGSPNMRHWRLEGK